MTSLSTPPPTYSNSYTSFYPSGLTLDSSGDLFAVAGSGEVLEYTPNSNSSTGYNTYSTLFNISGASFTDVVFDPTTGDLLITDDSGSRSGEVLVYSTTGTYLGDYSTGSSSSDPQYLAPLLPPSPAVAAPAPGGLVLFALGFGGFGLLCRRRIAPHRTAAA